MEPSTSGNKFDLRDDDEERLCRVCSEKSDGAHFGIDSCRACAAFFRRSVVMKKKYVCRQGNNNCDINKTVRCMCRKCRLRKCLEAGMLAESVQSKRDNPIYGKKDSDIMVVSPKEVVCNSENEMFQKSSSSAFRPVIPMQNTPPPNELPEMLMKINNNYKTLCAVRKATEVSLNRNSVRGIFANDGMMPDMTLASCRRIMQVHRSEMPAIGEFISSTFPEFCQLCQEEKWTVFQNFVVTIWCMDSAYRTYRRVSPTEFNKKTMITETMYIHSEHLDEFLADAPETLLCRADFVSVLRATFSGPRIRMVKQMYELQLQEEEYAALLALTLWNSNIEKGTEAIDAMGKEIRKQIYQQLHLWYRSSGMENYAERIGEILNLVSTVLHCITRLKENIELCNLFDLFSEDSFMYDMVKEGNQMIAPIL